MGGGVPARTIFCATLLVLAVLASLGIGFSPGGARATTPSPAADAAPTGTYFDHVVIIVMENHAICDILTTCGGAGAYETELANASGLATSYTGCGGRSLLSYLCLTAASSFGCTKNDEPNSSECTALAWKAPTIIDRLVDAGLTWTAYMENMTSPCQVTSDGDYGVRHNPFVYYEGIVSNASRCARVLPAGVQDSALLSDLAHPATASNYIWLTPNLCNDMDDCPVQTADAYLAGLVPAVLQSPTFVAGRAALFLTFEEPGGGTGAPHLYAVWAGPAAKSHFVSSAPYTHFSLLATLEANWKLPPLNANDSAAPDMREFFVGPPVVLPLAGQIGVSRTVIVVGQSVTFTATASGGTAPYGYEWAFGDGRGGSGVQVSHVFAYPGTYTVHLTITDSAAGAVEVARPIVVTSPPPSPEPPNPLLPIAVGFPAIALAVLAILAGTPDPDRKRDRR